MVLPIPYFLRIQLLQNFNRFYLLASNANISNSFKLLTDGLVKESITYDFGSDVSLISWKFVNFTNDGDNFSSIVTSICVKYKKEENELHTSYIVKLNPLRPMTCLRESMKSMYKREVTVLSCLVDRFNDQLKNNGMPKIKVPKLVASDLTFMREVIIMEDLRSSGFRMFDRKNTLDLNHSIMVVEELARIHGSSVVLKRDLPQSSIEENFPNFKEPFNKTTYGTLSRMLIGQMLNLSKILEGRSDYTKVSEWLRTNAETCGQMYFRSFTLKPPFEVLCHGDCWANNLLFKYDDPDVPIDVRLVDFQTARVASPAFDLVNFFFTSLSREERRSNQEKLIDVYFKAFSNVLLSSGIHPAFSVMDLKREINEKLIYAITYAVFILPRICLTVDENCAAVSLITETEVAEYVRRQLRSFQNFCSNQILFKERFLSIFDDLMDAGFFD